MLKHLLAVIRRLRASHVVTVYWGGAAHVHYATSEADALEWLACYPADAWGYVNRSLNGLLVAQRSGPQGV